MDDLGLVLFSQVTAICLKNAFNGNDELYSPGSTREWDGAVALEPCSLGPFCCPVRGAGAQLLVSPR